MGKFSIGHCCNGFIRSNEVSYLKKKEDVILKCALFVYLNNKINEKVRSITLNILILVVSEKL